jgi:hypothetical protein
MEQRIFFEDNERIRNFIQLTYITLSSTGAVPLRRLEEAYRAMEPVIHPKVNDAQLDCGALSYAALRLPPCVTSVERILLGQSESILEESGVPMSAWTEVFARARRRRYLHDGAGNLICFIASKSDVDDIIPSLLALQIEWNKAHAMLAGKVLPAQPAPGAQPALSGSRQEQREAAAALLGLAPEDAAKLELTFGDSLGATLAEMAQRPLDFYVRNFEASYRRYRRETETWWRQIETAFPGIEDRPVYFVSSNTHSLINLMSGYAEANRAEILAFAASDPALAPLLSQGARGAGTDPDASLLYYFLMKHEQQDASGGRTADRIAYEESVGIRRIVAEKTLDIPTQIVDLRVLAEHSARFAPFRDSDAVVLNIDYPLGRTAYFLLVKLAEHFAQIRGVYVIGKAASLFADRGDIIIPSLIIDQHTRNQYFVENCLGQRDVEPYLDKTAHAIYDNQKAVTVLGTFLQNKEMLTAFLSAGITDLEMEAGPYLAALYEMARPKRYPENEIIPLRVPNLDLGIIHYVSDNPLSGRHLDRRLDLDGVDATYAATSAVLDRITKRESQESGR